MDEANPLQQLLEQFEKARVQERRLRKQEFSELVAAIKAPLPPSSITAAQPVVRNSPNFTKFFAPTLMSLASLGCYHVRILSLSNGNADGLGTIREQEMLSACSFLKVPRENVDILDDPALQDGQSVIWRPVLISQVIERTVTSHNIDMILTFDSYGVSGHPNHTAVYWGVCEFLLRSAKSYKQEDLCVEAWNLESVGILKKYSGPIYGLWSMWRYRTTYQSHQFFSQSPLYCFQAMQKHATQWLWYRRLFVVFSHYSYMNTLRRFTT
ncbi:hypothetical protein L7F22_040677 [Adiantum nelumboides]|nr:hypothetical protein [Adiantum nelumboides]